MRLIEANRTDQRVAHYETWRELRGYCALSADPVGELVLGVFGLATAPRIAHSDSICTALQLIEHCQDVAEDRRAGRVYLPAEDLRRFGCEPSALGEAHAGRALRAVIAFELLRARRLLADGAPLLGELRGRVRLAVAAFIAGGRRRSARSNAPAATCSPVPRGRAAPGACWRWGAVGVGPGRGARMSAPAPAVRPTAAAKRSRASRPRTSTTGSACCRGRAAARMCAAYAFARRVDDIGDGPLERRREAAPAGRRERCARASRRPRNRSRRSPA